MKGSFTGAGRGPGAGGALLLVCALLCGPVLAQKRPDVAMPPPLPGGPPPRGPRPEPLSFADARAFAARAASVVRQVKAGELRVRPSPQGPRLTVPLLFQGRPVAEVVLDRDLNFVERPAVPLLEDVTVPPAVSAKARAGLDARVAGLAASGLAEGAGRHVRVPLVYAGAVVTDLRFDRVSGVLLAEPDRPGPPPRP
ncbi:hypothetical protein [Deinococcus aquiradiocola]|uniref:Uncharacterized protein n=1 Tax=Deinococcus aquiradiocola TaxID=393059 RepID=A0A917PC53_9DEIO|nr:hypothetical protein [Deinococcus aquiradiocola]GGJ70452.1 hypothetical protein GCM10008939_13580 [Deinococcus aquiradiocola]